MFTPATQPSLTREGLRREWRSERRREWGRGGAEGEGDEAVTGKINRKEEGSGMWSGVGKGYGTDGEESD